MYKGIELLPNVSYKNFKKAQSDKIEDLILSKTINTNDAVSFFKSLEYDLQIKYLDEV